MSGKYDANELKAAFAAAKKEFVKYKKGELSFLHNVLKSDVRLWTSEQAQIAKEIFTFLVSNFKKVAYVYSSFMHQKSNEAATGNLPDNLMYFSSEEEAQRWLLG